MIDVLIPRTLRPLPCREVAIQLRSPASGGLGLCSRPTLKVGLTPSLVVLSRVDPTVNDLQATLPDGAAWGSGSGEAARLILGLPARSAAAVDETRGGNGVCAAPQTGAVLGHR